MRQAVWTAAIILGYAASAPGAEGPIRHRFLAVDTLEGKRGLHCVDERDPTGDWSVAGSWRDMQLIGDNRVALSDPDGVSIVDMKTRKVAGVLRPKGLRNVFGFCFTQEGLLVFNSIGRGLVLTDPLGVTSRTLVATNSCGLVRPAGGGGWAFGLVSDRGDCRLADVGLDGSRELARMRVPGAKPVHQTCKLANGAYLVTAGYGGFAAEIGRDGEMSRHYATSNKFYYAGCQVLSNKNVVVANWTGHNEGERGDPGHGDQIIEFLPSGRVAWSYNNPVRLGCVLGVMVLDGIDTSLPHDQVYGVLVPTRGVGAMKVHATVAAAANSLDGIAVLPDGSVIVSVPNLNNRKRDPELLKIAPDGSATSIAVLRPGQGSERVVPFGVDVVPTGEVYVADNQFFSENKPQPGSRIVAVGADRLVREVATGLRVANGVRVHGDHVYVTDSQLPGTGSNMVVSAVYRFPLWGDTVQLEPDPAKCSNLIARFETAMVRDPFGADGIVFDRNGMCYVSMFDAGAVVRFKVGPKGRMGPAELVVPQGTLASADGLACDRETGAIFIADPRANAVHRWHPKEGLRIHARTTTDRSAGCLDSPVDLAISGDKILVSNWTTAGGRCVISAFPLK